MVYLQVIAPYRSLHACMHAMYDHSWLLHDEVLGVGLFTSLVPSSALRACIDV